jgi:hypothetical protein
MTTRALAARHLLVLTGSTLPILGRFAYPYWLSVALPAGPGKGDAEFAYRPRKSGFKVVVGAPGLGPSAPSSARTPGVLATSAHTDKQGGAAPHPGRSNDALADAPCPGASTAGEDATTKDKR